MLVGNVARAYSPDKKNVAVNYLGLVEVSGWLQFPGTYR